MPELMDKPRLNWACRRGMLELDSLLRPFLQQQYDALSLEEKHLFEKLLACDDPQIFAWFMRSEVCSNPQLNALIDKIRPAGA
tara:strand:- start:3327 stop:3575 length:249 start_codon:yes stop_codon:yes gene_type:complete